SPSSASEGLRHRAPTLRSPMLTLGRSSLGEEVLELALHRLGVILAQGLRAVVLAGGDVLEDLAKLLGGFLRVESHHADRGALIENRREDRSVSHESELDVVPPTLVEKHRELVLAKEPRHLASRGIAARDKGGNGLHVEVVGR